MTTDCIKDYPEFWGAVNDRAEKWGDFLKLTAEDTGMYSGNVGKCLRQLVIVRLKNFKWHPTRKQRGNMLIGSAMEEAFKKEILIPAGIFRGRNRVRVRATAMSGETDAGILDPLTKQKVIMECKCPNPYGYSPQVKEILAGNVRRDYLYQLMSYLMYSNAAYGILCILSRESLTLFRAFKVVRDKKIMADIKFRCKAFSYCVKKKKYPQMESGDFCQWCDVSDHCKRLPIHLTFRKLKKLVL